MAIKTILKNRTDDLGKSEPITCPACKKKTQLQLFSNYDLDNYIGKLLGKDKELNFAVCPLCASVFSINMSSFGVQNSPLHDYNLTLIKKETENE
ncbi:MAG: hypothetical protein ACI4F5_07535 [Acutalibacteraceae bacterium]